jgi:hypothetical protein
MKISHALGTAFVIAAGATLGISAAQAQSNSLSDQMVVTDPAGISTTFSIIEGAAVGGAGELGAVYRPVPGLDPGSMDIPFLLSVGAHFVMLTEAPGEIPGPGEIGIPVPCPVQPGQCILSDIVVGYMDAVGAHVGFYSDPHPAFLDPALPGLFPIASFLGETGAMQDVTGLLGFASTSGTPGFTVGVMSDHEIVPVPAAVWLFGSAIGVIGVMRRKAAV